MRLLSFTACGGKPFRTLAVADAQLTEGLHEELRMFDCVFTNVTVRVENDVTHLDIPTHLDWTPDFSVERTSDPEYIEIVGQYSPSIETLLSAHIIKGALPTLVQDHDAFIDNIVAQINALPQIDPDDIKRSKNCLWYKNMQVNTWELYQNYLMVGGDLYVKYGADQQIHFANNHIPEQGLTWWVTEHNKQVMKFAQENEMLCGYFSFANDRWPHNTKTQYTFVYPTGVAHPILVDDREFYHMAMLNKFPVLSWRQDGDSRVLNFEYREYFPEAYHKYRDTVSVANNMTLGVLRFI